MTIVVPTDVKAAIDLVIKQDEGGWVLSQDSDGGDGGWTYAGMTAYKFNEGMACDVNYQQMFYFVNQLAAAGGKPLIPGVSTVADLKEAIYELYYRYFFSNLIAPDPSIQAMEFSAAVNMGSAQARQIAFGNKEPIGFAHDWLVHYARICQGNPEKLSDLVGWINRVFKYLKPASPAK